MTTDQVIEFLNSQINDGVVIMDNLSATKINRAFFSGDMSTYEDAIDVYDQLVDTHLYY